MRRLFSFTLWVEAAILLCVCRLLLWFLPFRWLSHVLRPRPFGAEGATSAADLVRALENAARVVPGANCLVRAMAAGWLFASHGRKAAIRIGVARTPEGFGAHAWIEADGAVLIGGPVSQFTGLI